VAQLDLYAAVAVFQFMKIAFFETTAEEKRYFTKKFKGHNLMFFNEKISDVPALRFKDAEVVCVFIYSHIEPSLLNKLPKLKLIVTRSTGYDHIPLSACNKKGIMVANVPHYGENTVAEHTFALMLSLSRKVHKSFIRTLGDDYSIEGLQGFDLKGKTLGVIGVGRIGMHVIRIAKGFGMNVLAYDLHQDTFLSELLHYEYASVDELLKSSDIITLHMPYNDHTHHFLDSKKLSLTKKHVIIINTARGGLIDTDALYQSLRAGHVGGAGLDVIEGEELVGNRKEIDQPSSSLMWQVYRDKEIFSMDNVIFTPHNAFNSAEAVLRIMETAAENIETFVEKGNPKFLCK